MSCSHRVGGTAYDHGGLDMKDDPAFRRSFFGTPSPPKPSPGPWRVKGPVRERKPHGEFITWVVLDANDRCVAECERQMDAIFIAENGPRE